MTGGLPAHFETERLIIRAYQPDDGPMYFDVARKNREHLRPYEAGNVLMTIETPAQAEKVVRDLHTYWVNRQCYFLGAFEKDTGAFAAQLYIGGFKLDPPEYIIGYIADRDHEGRGYVTEAVRAALAFIFQHLGAHRVRIHCDETNLRSQRVAERCGFVKEGLSREDTRNPDGLLTGTAVYGLLRREYEREHA